MTKCKCKNEDTVSLKTYVKCVTQGIMGMLNYGLHCKL